MLEDLSQLDGWKANIVFFGSSHDTMVIRAVHPDDYRNEKFLLIYWTKDIPQVPRWRIGHLTGERKEGQNFVITDRDSGMQIRCKGYTIRDEWDMKSYVFGGGTGEMIEE